MNHLLNIQEVSFKNEMYGCYDVIVGKTRIGNFSSNHTKPKDPKNKYVLKVGLPGINPYLEVSGKDHATALVKKAILHNNR